MVESVRCSYSSCRTLERNYCYWCLDSALAVAVPVPLVCIALFLTMHHCFHDFWRCMRPTLLIESATGCPGSSCISPVWLKRCSTLSLSLSLCLCQGFTLHVPLSVRQCCLSLKSATPKEDSIVVLTVVHAGGT